MALYGKVTVRRLFVSEVKSDIKCIGNVPIGPSTPLGSKSYRR